MSRPYADDRAPSSSGSGDDLAGAGGSWAPQRTGPSPASRLAAIASQAARILQLPLHSQTHTNTNTNTQSRATDEEEADERASHSASSSGSDDDSDSTSDTETSDTEASDAEQQQRQQRQQQQRARRMEHERKQSTSALQIEDDEQEESSFFDPYAERGLGGGGGGPRGAAHAAAGGATPSATSAMHMRMRHLLSDDADRLDDDEQQDLLTLSARSGASSITAAAAGSHTPLDRAHAAHDFGDAATAMATAASPYTRSAISLGASPVSSPVHPPLDQYAVLPAPSLPPEQEPLHSPLSPVPLIGTPPPLTSPSSARDHASAHAGASHSHGPSGGPSTLSLLHSLQSLHGQTSSMRQSLSHYLSFQSQALIELEEDVVRLKYVETALRVVREVSAGGGGAHGGAHGGSGAHLLQVPLHVSFTSTPTAALLAQYSTACSAHLFDKRRLASLAGAGGNSKPFGYAHEQEYRKLIHLVRARPSLLAFALASFQWQLMSAPPASAPAPGSGSGATTLSTHTPLIDPATVSHHRRSIEAVSQAVVWDVFGSGGGGAAGGGGGAAGGGGGGSSGPGGADGSGSGGAAPGSVEARKVAYVVRMTLRIMWEREVERMATEQRAQSQQQQQQVQNQQQAAVTPASPSSFPGAVPTPIPTPGPLLPLHLFEHHAFLPRLLHELSLSCGGEFLHKTLKDIVHVVLVHDDQMDLSQDLVSGVSGSGAAAAGSGPSAFSPAVDGVEMETRTPQGVWGGGTTPSLVEGADMGSAAAGGAIDPSSSPLCSTDPVLAALASFPPPAPPAAGTPSAQATGALCAASSPLPRLHGRPTSNLFDLCTTLLEKMHAHVDLIPEGMRGVARDLARLCMRAQAQHEAQYPAAAATAAAAPPSPSSSTSSSLLPFDPNFEHPATRLLSEYFFLHWLVAALLSPESYSTRAGCGGAGAGGGGGGGGLTDGYPVSPLARRNLQAIGTVLIKLTSGSRFSSFSAAARKQAQAQSQAQQGQGQHTPPTASPSTPAAPTSRLDRFLELHQPRVSAWLRRVIDPPHAQPDGEDSALEREMEMEWGALGTQAAPGEVLTVPKGWMPHDPTAVPAATVTAAAASAGSVAGSEESGWASLSLSSPGTSPSSPILLLPNDLFALHGLLKGCWNAAVAARAASAPPRMRRHASSSMPPPPPPTPVAQLPLPAFPACLRDACSGSGSTGAGGSVAATASRRWLSPSCPYSEREVTSLLSCLVALGDVPNFVPAHENVYVCLDAALPSLRLPAELDAVRGSWPFDAAPLRHAADVLLSLLSQLPPLRPDPGHECVMGLGALFRSWGALHAHSSSASSLAPLLAAVESVLRAQLPPAWQEDSFRPFLLCMQARLLREHSILLHSARLGSRLLQSWGGIHRVRLGFAARDLGLQAQFRAVQTKRLLELTRPKIRRLKKFLAAKTTTTPMGQQQATAAVAAPMVPPSGATAAALSAPSLCGGHCPDNVASDRLLCSACSKLLDRRRGLLKSFMAKYVIGEGVVIASHPHTQGEGGEGAAGASSAAAAAAGGGASMPLATINAFAIPESSPMGSHSSSLGGGSSTSGGAGAGAGAGHSLLVSVGTGPPLDIRDPGVSIDIQDYILASAYPELFVRCDAADQAFIHRASRMATWFQGSFVQFYVFMAVMDAVHDPARAVAVWTKWRDGYVQTQAQAQARASQQASTTAPQLWRMSSDGASLGPPGSEDPVETLGRQMGLTGHEPVWVDLPSESGGPRSSSNGGGVTTKPREIRIPYIGARPFFAAYAALRRIDAETKPKSKLGAFIQARSLLLSTLATSSFSDLGRAPALGMVGTGAGASTSPSSSAAGDAAAAIGLESLREPVPPAGRAGYSSEHLSAPLIQHRIAHLAPLAASSLDDPSGGSGAASSSFSSSGSGSGGGAIDEVEAGSVEDLMSSLCFLLLTSQPPFFLSNMHFLKSLFPLPSLGCKAFVDMIVATKYLEGPLWDVVGPCIRAKEAAEEEARREAEAEQRRREQKAREEAELQQQAHDLSRQIQEMQMQQQAADEALALAQEQALAVAQAQAQALAMQQAQAQALELDSGAGAVSLPPAHSPVLAATSAYELMAAAPLGEVAFALGNGGGAEHGSGFNGTADTAAAAVAGGAALDAAPSSSSSSHSAPASNGGGAVWSRLASMGFASDDISAALALIDSDPHVAPPNDETAFLVALDLLTVLSQAIDAGFPRDAVLGAVQHAVGVRGLTLDKLTRALQFNGMHPTSPQRQS